MYIGTLKIDLLLFGVKSLKEKRQIIKKILDTVRSKKWNMAVAEVDNMDKWSRATLGFTTIAADRLTVEKRLVALENFIEEKCDVSIIGIEKEVDLPW